MIERVHKFPRGTALAEARILHSRKIALDDARRANSRKQRRKRLDVVGEWFPGNGLDQRGVEPTIDRPLVRRQRDVLD